MQVRHRTSVRRRPVAADRINVPVVRIKCCVVCQQPQEYSYGSVVVHSADGQICPGSGQ